MELLTLYSAFAAIGLISAQSEGPYHWNDWFEKCGKGKSQSPINIIGGNSVYDPDRNITFDIVEPYSTENDQMYLVNTGHTVVITTDYPFTISGGNLPATYKFLQFHLHWGEAKAMHQGSEHSISGVNFPLELHVVTYNNGKYSSPDQIRFDPNDLAVFGILFKESKHDNPLLTPFLSHLEKVKFPDKDRKEPIPPFSIKNIFPPFKDHFFQYNGSLTTPTCAEAVLWTVFAYQNFVSKKQIEMLQGISSSPPAQGFKALQNNYRPSQAVNNRTIYRSYPEFRTGKILSYSYPDDDEDYRDGKGSTNQLDYIMVLIVAMATLKFLRQHI